MAKRKGAHKTKKGTVAQSAFGPAAVNFGKELAPLGKEAGAVTLKVGRLLIGLVDKAVYGVEDVSIWLREAVVKRLTNVSPDDIIEPNPRIAIPAVQALIYSINENHIAEIFANLLAAGMNVHTKADAHPAFVEIIKQMSSNDARLLQKISRINWRDVEDRGSLFRRPSEDKWEVVARELNFSFDETSVAMSLSNLARLGLLEVIATKRGKEEGWVIFGTPPQRSNDEKDQFFGLRTTPLGRSFLNICVRH
jgi:hypothetical protein